VTDLGWQVIGEIVVDSGRIALIDSASDDAIERYWRDEAYAAPDAEPVQQLRTEDRGVPIGVVVTAGLGDGSYPVEGRIEDLEGAGRRLAEIRIRFLPHAVLGVELTAPSSAEGG
jgi:hypothetical protein